MLKNDSISDQLQYLEDEGHQFDDDNDISEDIIGSNFVPTLLPFPNEKCAIGDTFGQMQVNDDSIIWPNIDRNPINKFQSSGYIVCVFLTFYPTGKADFYSDYVRDVKPAKYFSYQLKYKDRRFVYHPH